MFILLSQNFEQTSILQKLVKHASFIENNLQM